MTTITQVSEQQLNKSVTVNNNFQATSPAGLFGIKKETTSALTFGYYGGIVGGIGAFSSIADGTLTLTNAATNYIEATTAGVVSSNTSSFTAGRIPLYEVVTAGSVMTTITDRRILVPGLSVGPLSATTLTIATGTITVSTPALTITQTWNSGGVTFVGATMNITDTASAAGSLLQRWQVGGSDKVSLGKSGALTLTGGTVTSSTPLINVTQTWNSGGVTFVGATMNITDTASASASLLGDWQVAGTSKASIRKDGMVTATNLTLTTGTITTSQPRAQTQTWNAGGVAFTAASINITDTASAAASLLNDWQIAGASKASIRKDGLITGASFTPTTTATNGLGLAGSNNPALYASTTKVIDWTTAGAAVTGTFSVSSTATFNSTLSRVAASGDANITVEAISSASAAFLLLTSNAATAYVLREGTTPILGGNSGDLLLYNGAIGLKISSAGAVSIPGTFAVTGATTLSGLLTTSNNLRFTGNTSLPAAGTMGVQSATGLSLWPITGSSYDFLLYDAAGSAGGAMNIPTGTKNVVFPGALTVGGAVTLSNYGTGGAVTVGAADSGGAGYKVLRVPN